MDSFELKSAISHFPFPVSDSHNRLNGGCING